MMKLRTEFGEREHWFAWFPVTCMQGRETVWLKFVERRRRVLHDPWGQVLHTDWIYYKISK